MDRIDLDALFQPDMLGDDLEAWLEESFMMKRSFRNCALISGLIERRQPGAEIPADAAGAEYRYLHGSSLLIPLAIPPGRLKPSGIWAFALSWLLNTQP